LGNCQEKPINLKIDTFLLQIFYLNDFTVKDWVVFDSSKEFNDESIILSKDWMV